MAYLSKRIFWPSGKPRDFEPFFSYAVSKLQNLILRVMKRFWKAVITVIVVDWYNPVMAKFRSEIKYGVIQKSVPRKWKELKKDDFVERWKLGTYALAILCFFLQKQKEDSYSGLYWHKAFLVSNVYDYLENLLKDSFLL